MNELCSIEHATLRYQPAAAVFSVPKAFAAWAVILFTTEIVSFALEYCTSWGSLVTLALMALIFSIVVVRYLVRGTAAMWRRRFPRPTVSDDVV